MRKILCIAGCLLALGLSPDSMAQGASPSAAATAASTASLASLSGKRVLIISAYAFGRPGVDSFVRSYVDVLVKNGVAIDNILVEYLNLNRNEGADYRRRLQQMLLLQYQDKPVDLIVTLQQPALDYLIAELKDLAPQAPLLVINTAAPARGSFGDHAVLLPSIDTNYRATVAQAMQLFPATERIIVGLGVTPADQAARRGIDDAIASLGLRVTIEYLDHLPLAGMLERAASAPPRSIIIASLINRDVTGATATPIEMLNQFAKVANAPVFVQFSSGVGNGAIGGSVLHVERLAQQTAQASLGVLSGATKLQPGLNPLPTSSTAMYDWLQLKRWGADPDRLPADTLFVNRAPSLWQEHRDVVLPTLTLIAVLSMVSITLFWQRRRLRVAEAQSRESEARFRTLVENAPEAILVYDVETRRFVDASARAETLFACSREDLLARGPEHFYLPEQPDGLPLMETLNANVARSSAGEQLTIERMVKAMDGRIFPVEVSVVALPSSTRKLLRAGYVDISERKRNEQELLQHRAHLEVMVSERTAALSVAVRDAEAANRAKSVFLANMSHELRTPLNSIIGFSQIMFESTSMFDDEKRNLAIINRSGHHLLALINDILELSKIEAGQARLAPIVVDIKVLLREVDEMLRLTAERKGVNMVIDCPATMPVVLLDAGKLRQVLLNLLSNAVKFTDAGTVTLMTRARLDGMEAMLEFVVRDTGCGVADTDQARIFEPFIQADTPRSQAGTGLGLTISREFVHLMGGSLKLQSQLGKGSEFSFAIPATLAGAQAGEAATAGTGQAHRIPLPLPEELLPVATVQPADLLLLDGGTRQTLRSALQQLDMVQVERLLAVIREDHADLGAGIGSMLAQHQYRQLCEMLEQTERQQT